MPKGITINRREYATVSWAVEDVMDELEKRGYDLTLWDKQRCHDMLKFGESKLKERMLAAGRGVFCDLIKEFIKDDEKRWVIRSGPWMLGQVSLYLYWQANINNEGAWVASKNKATLYDLSAKSNVFNPPGSEWDEIVKEFDIVDPSDNMPGEDE